MHDRRSIQVRLTEKGIKLRDGLTVMHQRHAEMLTGLAETDVIIYGLRQKQQLRAIVTSDARHADLPCPTPRRNPLNPTSHRVCFQLCSGDLSCRTRPEICPAPPSLKRLLNCTPPP